MAKQKPEPLLTDTVPNVGKRYFNLGKDASYRAVARGDIPVIRIGRLLRVPIAAMNRLVLGDEEKKS